MCYYKLKGKKMKDLRYYLNKALENHFALGAFNFSGLETLQGITIACKELNSPAIITVSEGALNYMGDYVTALANTAKKQFGGLFLHLDHGKSFDICKTAVDMGFDSVMIDGSSLTFENNIKLTKSVCDYAHKKGVLVEGELGQIKGIEEDIAKQKDIYTNPQNSHKFVKATSVDMLAVSIGTSHGAYKYTGQQTLRFDILEEIEKMLGKFPLVLHGASTIDNTLIEIINENGGEIHNASGIPENLLKIAVKKHNIVKVNTDSDLRLAITSMTRQCLNMDKALIDPRFYLGKGRDKVKKVVENKIKNVFFSKNQFEN